MGTNPTWWVIVPMKDTHHAKSRLGGDPGERRQLAIVMARDTLYAVVNADSVAGVLVVCDTVDDIESFTMPGVSVAVSDRAGLNGAIGCGATRIRAVDARRNLAVVLADMPYLRSSELDVALLRAADVPSICIADLARTGTTLLTARADHPLTPEYGEGSLQAHRSTGAVELYVPVWSGLRRDVDRPNDLALTADLGASTRELLCA